ncbi:MAG: SAM-dependent methyltransferase [Ruminococcaceae bacterium]|nr:SAM-dependent methyltransferase [Oscillospiraceae bacterium]
MDIKKDERLDEVNDRLSLIQKTGGLTFGTDALLLAGYVSGKYKRGVELGGGSGIISMLLLARDKISSITAYEVQEDYAELISRNADLNRLSDRLISICADIRTVSRDEDSDIVFTNPPYMKSDAGKNSDSDAKAIARHEFFGNIDDFCHAASKKLKYGGAFYAVYRPDRLADVFAAMRKCDLEPKRMTFVHADTKKEASMVLIEAKRGGKSGMILTPPLIIYKDMEHREYGEDMNFIMENGSFPQKYKR